MFDDLKNMASDALGNIMNATDLDEKAIAMLEEKIGKENVEQIKQAVADGKIDEAEMSALAEKLGVPKEIFDLVAKFYQK